MIAPMCSTHSPMSTNSWELSPATFLHHPVVRPIAVVDHQCDHTTMRSHHPRCTRSHTRSTAPVNSLSHSLLLSRANTEPIRIFRPDSKTIRKRFESTGPDSLRKYCESAFRRLIRRFRLFSAFLKRVFSGVPFLYFTPICTATAKCRGSAKSRAFRPHRRVTARESTASEYELDRGDSMLIRFRFESENADSVRKRVSRANSSFLNIW